MVRARLDANGVVGHRPSISLRAYTILLGTLFACSHSGSFLQEVCKLLHMRKRNETPTAPDQARRNTGVQVCKPP